jgi:hypothetical protein
LRFAKHVRILTPMSEQGDGPRDETTGAQPEDGQAAREERGAAEDLAAGLDLMLRAAKKAMRHVDPANVEKLGRRALESIEHLKRERVEELGRKAKRRLDPRRVEEIAEEAGRELLRVVERVAERVDQVVKPSQPPQSSAPGGAEPPDKAPETEASSDPENPTRIRVEE